jgi:outer membrane lipoprotein-sorting protein
MTTCLRQARRALITLVTCHALLASTGSPAELDAFLAQVQHTYEKTQALTADFIQVATLTSINREQISSGKVSIQKPHAIRWDYTRPEAQTILYTNDTLRVYTPKRRQILQSTLSAEDRTNVALLFLAGLGTLQEVFTATALPSPEQHLQRIRLLPRSRQASFTELHIVVNRHDYFIQELIIHDYIGNRTAIRLSGLQTHPNLPVDTFTLVVPPDTEILTQPDLTGRR